MADPGHRRRGIGARLLEAVCDSAHANGFDRVTVHVWADNDDACRLYGAHGFEPIGHAAIRPNDHIAVQNGQS